MVCFAVTASDDATEPHVDRSTDGDFDPLDAFMSSLYDEDAPEKPVKQIALEIVPVAESNLRAVHQSLPFAPATDSSIKR